MSLITKTDVSISDSSLLPLGAIRILSIKKGSSVSAADRLVTINGSFTATINGDGYFTDSGFTTNQGKTISFSGNSRHEFYTSDGDYEIFVTPKYGLVEILITSSYLVADLNTFEFTSDLQACQLYSTAMNGSVEAFKKSTSLISLSVATNLGNYDGLNGNLDVLTDCPLIGVTLRNSKVSATMGFLAQKTSLISIDLSNCPNVSGDISAFANRNNIRSLNIGGLNPGINTSITGSITSLGKNINALTLSVAYTGVTGTAADLAQALADNGKTTGSVVIRPADGSTTTYNFPLT